jgi:alpha-glucoside transport system permease protein
MFALGLYLAYPVFETLRLSLTDRSAGGAFVGGANYARCSSEAFWEARAQQLPVASVVPAAATAFGLAGGAADRPDRWGNIAKSLIFMPMAISFVGAAVIWQADLRRPPRMTWRRSAC